MALNARPADSGRPIKVMHVIAGLESGGAEMSLSKLVTHMDKTRFACSVVSLTDEGPILGAHLRTQGIPVCSLGHGRGVANPAIVLPLARLVRESRPDVMQTWMYHADLCGAFAGSLVNKVPVVWGVHNTLMDPAQTKRLTRAVIRLSSFVSRWGPQTILCSSEAARSFHAGLGYPPDKLQVIESGIDTAEFVPDPAARTVIRQELGLRPETPLIGLSARFHPQKDHGNFIRAASLLHAIRPDAHFLLWGAGVTPENAVLREWLRAGDVEGVTHLLGLRRDTARLTAALDAACLSSAFGESFGLVLGEAMACGVPVVTTDQPGPVGVVGDLGWVVPVRDPDALCDAWRVILDLSPAARNDWSVKARQSILTRLSLRKTVSEYEEFYSCMVRHARWDGGRS